MKLTKTHLLLIVISIVAFVIRLYHLELMPLYPDETGGHFYYYWINNNYILGQNPLEPIIGKIVSLTWLWGLNEWSVRAPAAIFTSLLGCMSYWWISGLSSEKKQLKLEALLTAIIISILPWSFMIGRIGHSFIPLMLLSLMGSIGFYLRGKHAWSVLILILGSYFYPSMIVMSFFLSILYFSKYLFDNKVSPIKLFSSRQILILGICMLILGALFVIKYKGLSLTGRALDLAIWRDVNVTAETNEQRGLSRDSEVSFFSLGLPTEQLVNKIFLTKSTAIINEFGQRYWSFWSPDWLFIKGDPILRHSTSMNGQFWWWLAPFMVIGAYGFFNNSNKWEKWLVGMILLVSPIPAAITSDGEGYLLRSITMLPFLTYLAAHGIATIYYNFTKNYLRIGYLISICIFIFFSSWNFYFKYFHVYPVMAARSFEDGWRELSQWQLKNEDKPLLVIWQGYYADETFRFWQNDFKNYPLVKVETINVNDSAFYKTNKNLYFGWPKTAEDLNKFIANQNFYIAFSSNYLQENPQFQNVVKSEVTQINGKYLQNVWRIWRN